MNTPVQGRQPAIAFIFVTMMLSVLGFGLLIPVLPGLVTQFNGGDVAAGSHSYGLLVCTFSVLQFLGAPILGALSDHFGRRKVILISLACTSVDYVILANAPDMTWLFIGRVISGFTAGVLSTANAYVADITVPEKRAQSFGLLGAAFGLGFIIGPLIGGALGHINLRLPFWFAAACAALNWLYGYFVLPESLKPENRRRFEWKRANPLGAFKALGRFPAVRGMADASFLMMLCQTVMYSTWVLCLSYRYQWSPAQVGFSLCAAGVLSAVVQALLIKRIVPRLGETKSILVGISISACALIGYGMATEGWMIYAIMSCGCLGGIAAPAMQSYITRRVPANEQGAVQGVFSSLQSLAGIPGPLIGTWSFGWAVAPENPWHIPGIAFFECALLAVVALWMARRTFAANS